MLTLTSDFGTPYPAAMKGVILSRTDAQLVDIAHDLPRQDPRAAAFWLRETVPYFPPAVHLAVVDPGVGTDRAALAIRVGDHALVGPDNGLLRPVVRRLRESLPADEPMVSAYEIVVDDPASTTFHGRDVFAPAAAEIHDAGVDRIEAVEMLASLDLSDCVDLEFPTPTRDDGAIHGEVLVVDDFGNAITNVPGEWLADSERVAVNDVPAPVVETFAAVEPGERLLTVGSHGYVECDVNQGRGDDAFGLVAGDTVTVVPAE
ncbi:S-adenosyl-l-methionine hydroxide adenosyltransferase [Halonotius terrestris]|uniref:S-adenosyl-l-methionine hydroxide adenosyltransferase n=1 Tax=Halonotius terrestris TaxID=2487750 RepID=A0A8J8P8H2_9EURY|nr:SAM-dependent chlorinase/fluorinase [Halonotius terrestris]TQQ82835.1 S-adenosyl-l-methionine hydroxide adenosyltransferase [Halonotius terrestris]